MLGFDTAERTVARTVHKRPEPGPVVERWKVFLRNHQEAIVGMDFFSAPTATISILHVLVFVHIARRCRTAGIVRLPRLSGGRVLVVAEVHLATVAWRPGASMRAQMTRATTVAAGWQRAKPPWLARETPG